jgi:hypothetical protein
MDSHRDTLYIDGLNQFGLRPRGKASKQGSKWLLKGHIHAFAEFVAAARRSGFNVIRVFIDASTGDAGSEAELKWLKRRERDVTKGKREVPQSSNVLIGDLFRALGVSPVYSVTHDCDDTIAAAAQRDEADVLSSDSDFFRYSGSVAVACCCLADLLDPGACFASSHRLRSKTANCFYFHLRRRNRTSPLCAISFQVSALMMSRASIQVGELFMCCGFLFALLECFTTTHFSTRVTCQAQVCSGGPLCAGQGTGECTC